MTAEKESRAKCRLIMNSEITHLFLKDHSCLQSRHDVLKQAASCCIEREFSAGHHIAVHQLQREDK